MDNKHDIQPDTTIQLMTPELLFLAQSGQPYRGTVYVEYISNGRALDLIYFKKYITSLRSKKMWCEDIASEIYKTIDKQIKNNTIGVVVDLTGRGGIQQTISYGKKIIPERNKNKIFQI